MEKSKPFGLIIPKKAKTFQTKKTSIFESDSDDEPTSKKPTPIPQAKPLSKKLEQKELCEDPSIYEYDSIYDDMKAQEVSKVAGPKDNKPSRYIDTLLKAADKRKKEYERRIERKVQVEREKEGDKFKDKEAFVTSSYKKKMQEMEEAEERERRENMLNDMMDVTKQKDLSGFYRHFLKQSIGEENVPVFGEKRTIKEEPKSDDEDKRTDSIQGKKRKNVESNKEREQGISSKKKKEGNEETNLTSKTSHSRSKMYRKGRSDSDDEEVPNPSNENTTILDPNLDGDSDIVSSCEEEDGSNHSKSKESLKDKFPPNSSEVCSDNEKGSSKHKKITKNIRKRTNDDLSASNSSESSNEDEEENNDSSANDNSLNGHKKSQTEKVEDAGESEKPKPKRNWLEKRTVGEVFAAAQARFFQRLAARNA